MSSDGQRYRTFNPGLAQSDAEIVDQFVVRHEELSVVVDTIKENMASDSCQSLLIIGQRGSGKTMLLTRIVAELRTHAEYQGVIPVRFSEESDEVIDATRFWLELLRQIAQEIRTSEPQLAEAAHATLQDLSDRWRDSNAEDQAQSAALRLVHRLGKQVVLMVENLQSLFSSADASFGWKLREALQSSSSLMLIGTATLRFESMDRVDMPFFEFFRVVNLGPLKVDACQELWNKLTRGRFPSRQARPLEILTGGNPRLLVIASNFASHDSLTRLMEELIRLIDHYTEYFKSRLEEIPTKERIVFLSMLDLWHDSTLNEIATRARMSSGSVSGLLNRLTDRGAITKLGSGRKHVYSVNERLFCFYYKLRYHNDGVAVVEHLVNFMASFYGGTESRQLRQAISDEAKTTPFLLDSLSHAKANFRFKPAGEMQTRYENFAEQAHESIARLLWVNEMIERSVEGMGERVDDDESFVQTRRNNSIQDSDDELTSFSMFKSTLQRVTELTKQFEYDKALEVLSDVFRVLASAPDETDKVFRAVLVYQIGELSSIMRRERDSADAFDYFVDHFHELNEPFIRKLYVFTLKSQASKLGDDSQFEEALRKLDTAIACVENLERLGTLAQDEYLSYEDIVDIRVQQSILLRNTGRLEECLGVLDEMFEADRMKSDPRYESFREIVQIEKGVALRAFGRNEDSVKALAEVIEAEVPNQPPKWTSTLIRAYRELVLTQTESDSSTALKTLDWLIQSVAETNDEKFDLELVRLMERKATMELAQENEEAAVATWNHLYDRFYDSNEAWVGLIVCNALSYLCESAFRKERWDQASRFSRRLDRLSGNLPTVPFFNETRFDASFLRTLLLNVPYEKEKMEALSAFRELGIIVEHGSSRMMNLTLVLIRMLLRSGTKETDLIEALRGNKRDDTVLRPLVLALRMAVGEDVRDPKEIQEVAKDVQREIYSLS